jgi:hypothetical protein
MHTIDITTQVGGLEAFGYEDGKYPLRVQQADSCSEAFAKSGKCDEDEVIIEAPQGVLDTMLGIYNAAQKQGASQGGKEKIRDAMTRKLKEGEDRQAVVDAAVTIHQTGREEYWIGAPRGGAVGGVTKTKAGNIGKALLERLGGEKLEAMAAEFGIDPEDLK